MYMHMIFGSEWGECRRSGNPSSFLDFFSSILWIIVFFRPDASSLGWMLEKYWIIPKLRNGRSLVAKKGWRTIGKAFPDFITPTYESIMSWSLSLSLSSVKSSIWLYLRTWAFCIHSKSTNSIRVYPLGLRLFWVLSIIMSYIFLYMYIPKAFTETGQVVKLRMFLSCRESKTVAYTLPGLSILT